MKLLIAYASTDGQTRKIAQHIADRLFQADHTVELLALADADHTDLARFDRIVLAASIHAGHYQKALTDFVTKRTEALCAKPTLLLSVSLAAAGHDAEEWKSLEGISEDLFKATGWRPDRVAQIAGAYRPAEYDIFKRFIMRRIVAAKMPDADLDATIEYTDWSALDAMLEAWLTETPSVSG